MELKKTIITFIKAYEEEYINIITLKVDKTVFMEKNQIIN